MIAGMDRYFQIVRCFRDEDLRADRQPEFTQIDVEMSFATEELVYGVVEGAIQAMFGAAGRHGRRRRFRASSYDDAMLKYGSDKPDLRPGMPIADLLPAFDGALPDVRRASCRRRIARCAASSSPARGEVVAQAARRSRRRGHAARRHGSPGRGIGDGGLAELGAEAAGRRARCGRRSTLAGGSAGDLLAVHGRHAPGRSPTCSAGCGCTSPRARACSAPTTSGSAGSPSFRCSNGTRTRSAGTRCTIRSRRRGPRTCRCSRRRPSAARARAYDLALNGSEIAGGSIRIHRADVQRHVFRLLGISRRGRARAVRILPRRARVRHAAARRHRLRSRSHRRAACAARRRFAKSSRFRRPRRPST